MKALEVLKADHRLILRVLDALEVFAASLKTNPKDGRADLRKFNQFFQEFVGLNHHEIEETIVMPVLAAHGFRWTGGAFEKLRTDHRHEDGLLESIEQASLRDGPWSGYEMQALYFLLSEFIAFYRQHIRHENSEMIAAAAEKLDAEVMSELDERVTHFLDDRVGIPGRKRMLTLALELVAAYPRAGSGEFERAISA